MPIDFYEVLGVGRDANDDEIKRAYRRLAREYHPDVSDDPQAEQRFKEISAAYQTLSDPARRRQYDMFGSGQLGADQFPFGDLTDIFDAVFGGFGGFGGFGRRRPAEPRTRARQGEDLFARVSLTFEESVFGTERVVDVDTLDRCARCQGNGCEPGTHPTRCSRCGGSGQVQDVARSVFGTVMTARTCGVCDGSGREIGSPCTECRGEGRVPVRQKVTVEVPAGVTGGAELRVQGVGAAGRNEGPPGDLYVALDVAPHPVFERRGQDLVASLTVSFTQAALGAELEIETLDGPERLSVEPGTRAGSVIRLKGRGIPHLGRRGRGDLFLTVGVEVPKDLSRKERQLLQELAQLRGEERSKGTRGRGLLGRQRS